MSVPLGLGPIVGSICLSGADPVFEKGGGVGGSGARSQDFF